MREIDKIFFKRLDLILEKSFKISLQQTIS